MPECPTIAVEWYEEALEAKIIDDLGNWQRVVDGLFNPIHKSQERFEKYMKGEFENAGYSYNDLINLPAGAVEAVFALYVEEGLTWAQAATELLSKVSK